MSTVTEWLDRKLTTEAFIILLSTQWLPSETTITTSIGVLRIVATEHEAIFEWAAYTRTHLIQATVKRHLTDVYKKDNVQKLKDLLALIPNPFKVHKELTPYLVFFHHPSNTSLDKLLTFCRQVPLNYDQTGYVTIDGQVIQTVTLKKQFRISSPMNPSRMYRQHWVLFVQSSTRSYVLSGKFSDTNGNQGYGRYIDFYEKYNLTTKNKATLINLMLYGTN